MIAGHSRSFAFVTTEPASASVTQLVTALTTFDSTTTLTYLLQPHCIVRSHFADVIIRRDGLFEPFKMCHTSAYALNAWLLQWLIKLWRIAVKTTAQL